MQSALQLTLDDRWLEVRFAAPRELLSWAPVGGGRTRAEQVVWHYVDRAELPEDVDATALYTERLRARGHDRAVGLLTARRLDAHVHVVRARAGLSAECVATVGLGNALRAGDPATFLSPVGTINVLCHLDTPLSELALLEAMGLLVEARTAALLEARYPSVVSARAASGTGTDCCVMAAPSAGEREGLPYAGKHTLAGELIGAAVEAAVSQATRAWLTEQGAAGEASG